VGEHLQSGGDFVEEDLPGLNSFDKSLKLLLDLLDLCLNLLGLPDVAGVLNELLGRFVHLLDSRLVRDHILLHHLQLADLLVKPVLDQAGRLHDVSNGLVHAVQPGVDVVESILHSLASHQGTVQVLASLCHHHLQGIVALLQFGRGLLNGTPLLTAHSTLV